MVDNPDKSASIYDELATILAHESVANGLQGGIMKSLKTLLVFVLMLGLLAGCANPNTTEPTTTTTAVSVTTSSAQESSSATTSAASSETTAGSSQTSSTEAALIGGIDVLIGASQKAEKMEIPIATLKGPQGISLAPLFSKSAEGKTHHTYQPQILDAPDQVVAKLISGEVTIASVPANLAAVVNKKSGGAFQVLAVNNLGVLYILENGNEIQKFEDLEGKTIHATGQGASPEYLLDYLKDAAKIENLSVEYMPEHAALAGALASGEVKLGMLPEPFVTTVLAKNPEVRVALDLTKEWQERTNGSRLPMGVIIVKKDFAETHKQEVLAFLEEYAKSVKYATDKVEETSKIVVSFGILPNEQIAMNAIPRCNMVMLPIWEVRDSFDMLLKTFFEKNPKSIGGEMPDDGFYFTLE